MFLYTMTNSCTRFDAEQNVLSSDVAKMSILFSMINSFPFAKSADLQFSQTYFKGFT